MSVQSLCRALLALLAATVTCAAAAQEHVSFPSLDGAGNAPVVLTGFFFAAPSSPAPAAVAVLLHGCSGPYDRVGMLGSRMREYVALFNDLGMHALVVDSLTPRYEKEICTQRLGKRRITMANRRLDALGAVAYVAGRADVDPTRIGLIGWSNGGSAVLAATNLRHREVAGALVKPAFAIAFYPGCETELRRGYEPSGPLLVLVGQADDWTPAAPCRAMVKGSTEPKPDLEGYDGAFHGFDSAAPVRLRKDVPNGVAPGQGVHVGGNVAAYQASRKRLLAFLKDR